MNLIHGIEEVTIDPTLKVGDDEQGDQRLIWECSVVAAQKDYIHQGGIVHIDAHTGEIIQIYIPL